MNHKIYNISGFIHPCIRQHTAIYTYRERCSIQLRTEYYKPLIKKNV